MACGILPDQGLNPCPLFGRQALYPRATREALFGAFFKANYGIFSSHHSVGLKSHRAEVVSGHGRESSASGRAMLRNFCRLSSRSLVSRPAVSAPQRLCQKSLNSRVYVVRQAHCHLPSDFTSCSHAQRTPDHSVVSSVAAFLFSSSLVHSVPLTLSVYPDHSGPPSSHAVCAVRQSVGAPGNALVCWLPWAVAPSAPRLHVDRPASTPPESPDPHPSVLAVPQALPQVRVCSCSHRRPWPPLWSRPGGSPQLPRQV